MQNKWEVGSISTLIEPKWEGDQNFFYRVKARSNGHDSWW